MDVELSWFLVREKHSGVVIELAYDDRTLDAIIKRIISTKIADPAEECRVKVSLHFFHP